MSTLFCVYCFKLISEKDQKVVLEFDKNRSVFFHESWFVFLLTVINSHHDFCRKCTIIRKACTALRNGTCSVFYLMHYDEQELNERNKCTSYSPLSIPDQAEDNCICPICMDRRADSLLLPCRHRLCSDCILDWRRKSLSKRIPGGQLLSFL